MRIELPTPTWADTHHAQDDAHTLTLPAPRVSLADSLLAVAVAGEDGAILRIEVIRAAPPTLTLTFC